MTFRKYKDLILGSVMLVISGLYLYFAQQIKTRPKIIPSYSNARIFPTILGILLLAMSILLIIQGIRKAKSFDASKEDTGDQVSKEDYLVVVLTLGVILLYVLLMVPLGFNLSTMLYLFVQFMILAPKGKRKPIQFAVIAIAFSLVCFFVFRVGLSQMLPRGIIESLLGY
ncbi:MAG: tripartite tricarboxylate transporter TctB family protein [Christensenellales bacterium]|jgi:lysylphosphatidylglycerol synthetase-like protein (DUF2156 family)